MKLVAPDCYGDFADELHEIHRLRYSRSGLDWDVRTNGGYEIDSFHALKRII